MTIGDHLVGWATKHGLTCRQEHPHGHIQTLHLDPLAIGEVGPRTCTKVKFKKSFCQQKNILLESYFYLGHLTPGWGGYFKRRRLQFFWQLSRCSSHSQCFTWIIVSAAQKKTKKDKYKDKDTLVRQRWQVSWLTSQFLAFNSTKHLTRRKRKETLASSDN